jgi:hypothetical protein
VKKAFFLILIPVICSLSVLAQKPRVKNDPTHDDKPIHFGFSLGFNFMDFSVYQSEAAKDGNYYVGISKLTPGINIQAISNLRLSDNWDLRSLPGISFGERQLDFLKLGVNSAEGTYDSVMYEGSSYRIQSSFLELPITLKYKARRMNNFRPYFIAGGNIRYDLAVKKDYDYKEQLIMLKPFDFYAEFGTGFDFYLAYFKFAVELKYSIGMSNVFRSTNRAGDPPVDDVVYTEIIDKLKSHMFIISFHFE